MAELTVMSDHIGEVLVSEELVELLGPDGIDSAVRQLRLGGGECWSCGDKIHRVDDICLVVDATPAAWIVGFVHYRCGPPQIVDSRRSRRAAIAMRTYMQARSFDLQAFTLFRSDPAPRALLVVSPKVTISVRAENGDLISPWIDLSLQGGFTPIAPAVMETTPELVDGWSLRVEGIKVVCECPVGSLFEGHIETPQPWLNALASERCCVVLVTPISIDSSLTGRRSDEALDDLASSGLVAGGTVEVVGLLGLHAALGIGAAIDEAYRTETLTGRTTYSLGTGRLDE